MVAPDLVMESQVKKLKLSPDTIRVLTDLSKVGGGVQTDRTQSGVNCPAQDPARKASP